MTYAATGYILNAQILALMHDYKTISNYNNPWYCASCLTEIFPFNHYHDNNDFLYAIDYSLQSRLDLNNVNNMSFNPFIDDLDSHVLCSTNLT